MTHYNFKELFIRRTKKAFISYIPEDLIMRIGTKKRISTFQIYNVVKRKTLLKSRFGVYAKLLQSNANWRFKKTSACRNIKIKKRNLSLSDNAAKRNLWQGRFDVLKEIQYYSELSSSIQGNALPFRIHFFSSKSNDSRSLHLCNSLFV